MEKEQGGLLKIVPNAKFPHLLHINLGYSTTHFPKF